MCWNLFIIVFDKHLPNLKQCFSVTFLLSCTQSLLLRHHFLYKCLKSDFRIFEDLELLLLRLKYLFGWWWFNFPQFFRDFLSSIFSVAILSSNLIFFFCVLRFCVAIRRTKPNIYIKIFFKTLLYCCLN